jgi:NAD(P)-dependent dehydrogenase (short-subunit alcohol dehydrogenase family)
MALHRNGIQMTDGQPPQAILIIGASGGLGHALLEAAAKRYPQAILHAWSRTRPTGLDQRVRWTRVDITREAEIAAAASALQDIDMVIIATGLLHRAAIGSQTAIRPEKTYRAIDAAAIADTFAINAIAPALIAKHVLPKLPRDRRAVFAALSARVGSISDNRLGGWISYRASKAALNQVLRTLAIELARTHPHAICVGLHPGTVDTGLSQPFQASVAPDKLFAPAHAAGLLLDVLATRAPADSGDVFDWAGMTVPA